MQCSNLAAAPSQAAGDVHEATGIRGNDHIRSGLLDESCLVLDHRSADLREAHREGTAKTATFIAAFKSDVLKALDLVQEPFRRVLEAKTTQVTRHVIGNSSFKDGTNILDAEDIHQEVG